MTQLNFDPKISTHSVPTVSPFCWNIASNSPNWRLRLARWIYSFWFDPICLYFWSGRMSPCAFDIGSSSFATTWSPILCRISGSMFVVWNIWLGFLGTCHGKLCKIPPVAARKEFPRLLLKIACPSIFPFVSFGYPRLHISGDFDMKKGNCSSKSPASAILIFSIFSLRNSSNFVWSKMYLASSIPAQISQKLDVYPTEFSGKNDQNLQQKLQNCANTRDPLETKNGRFL